MKCANCKGRAERDKEFCKKCRLQFERFQTIKIPIKVQPNQQGRTLK